MISCEDFFETTLELEEPPFVELLVVNSILTNLTLEESRALVSKTIGLSDQEEESLVTDAEVKITFPDNTLYILNALPEIKLYSYYQYNYEGTIPELTAGKQYKIQVSSEEKSVTAQVKMPYASKLISAVYMENGGLDADGDEVSAIDIIIDDTPNEENYYKIGALKITDGYAQELYLTTTNSFALESATYQDLIIKDEQFDGKEFKLRLQFNDYDFYYGQQPQPAEYKVIMKSISKAQFDHDRILHSFFENNDNPFASPVQLASNIEGGLGLFALENTTIFDVEK